MNSSQLTLAILGATTIGCSNKGDIWLIEVDTTKGDGYFCENRYSANYSGQLANSDDSAEGSVTETTEFIGSKILFYAKLVDLSTGKASLNSGSLLLPGTEKDKDKWVFEWAETDVEKRSLTHRDGYVLKTEFNETLTTSISLTMDGKTAKGEMTIVSADSTENVEDDLWSEDAAREIGSYGSVDWNTADGWESNMYDTSDCDGDDCVESTASSCGATAPVTATLTDLSKKEDFASLAGLQQYGSFKTSSSSTWGGGGDSGWWGGGGDSGF